MKILLLNQTFYPDRVATSQQIFDLAQWMVGQGCEVTVLTGRRSYDDPQILYPPTEEHGGIHIRRVGSFGFGKKSFIHRILEGISFETNLLWNLFFLPRQDLVVSFTSPPLVGLFGWLFCAIKGGRSVQWLMDINPDAAIAVGYIPEKSVWARFLKSVFGFSLRRTDRIVVLDRWMRKTLAAYGIASHKVSTIPPWPLYTPKNFSAGAPDPRNPFRVKWGLQDKFIILYSGNHSIVHPLDTLIDYAISMKEDPDIRFVFMGNGLRVGDVEKAVRDFGLKNVLQLPPQPREVLEDALASANLHAVVLGERVNGLVHLSKIYGVLSSGRPYIYIGPSDSHMGALLEERPYGFAVEHGDVDQLRSHVETVRGFRESDYRLFGEKNFEYLNERFTRAHALAVFEREILCAPDRAAIPALAPA